MKFRVLLSAVFAAVLLIAAFSFVTFDPKAVEAKPSAFALDPSHSAILFSIDHMGLSKTWGRFNKFEGSFSLDGENPTGCSVSVTVDASTVDTGNGARDTHLQTADFFNVAQFPEMTFKSTSVAKGDKAGEFDVTGDLTLHGVKKSITVRMRKGGEKDLSGFNNMGYRAGFGGSFTVKRSDYEMGGMVPQIGDEVTMILAFEGVRQ